MPVTLQTIPCLEDNYAYLLHEPETGATAVIDAPEAAPIQAALDAKGWRLSDILITHHHHDHIGGVETLRRACGARVTGAKSDAHRLPPLDRAVAGGDTISVGRETATVIGVPGHTLGHIAFHFPHSQLLFTGDSLMALGCGRLFEGSAAQMWDSLSRLIALPGETLICPGHEYTESNARFALTIEPDNQSLRDRAARVKATRAEAAPTVPVPLKEELATNPFLRAHLPGIKGALGMASATDIQVFAEIRARKDAF
ncbi:hydroxyacylglutathione hydrolase [Rhodovulum imhoffii]|uniref:Hydroxyacylglutathione hydrolase n=1 Tax=Rhodovulum imhoffii TaxID=365340 RepID=A0A2T5BV87_9RHOB|nr:hydroxyacylglutathione hydrolase [Rhodovulum imhoffii]MBK5934629.1 hydroxyacylglutathione hydrolase [Rhodovulum imhoffii]PTN03397.1 hydroxyacylglutathione hydrolase [Rhodovulum imhoffii]